MLAVVLKNTICIALVTNYYNNENMKYFQINPCLYEHYCYGLPVKQDILMQSYIHHTCSKIGHD